MNSGTTNSYGPEMKRKLLEISGKFEELSKLFKELAQLENAIEFKEGSEEALQRAVDAANA